MAKEEKAKKKEKRPTAIKRDLQSEKARLRNKIYRSRVRTAIRAFQDTVANKGEGTEINGKLNEVYSILDKCVQKGVFKINKASRTKSRLAAKALAKA